MQTEHYLEERSGGFFANEFMAEGSRRKVMEELKESGVICEVIEFVAAGGEENNHRNILVRCCQHEEKVSGIFKKYSVAKLSLHLMDDYNFEIGNTVRWVCCMNSELLNS